MSRGRQGANWCLLTTAALLLLVATAPVAMAKAGPAAGAAGSSSPLLAAVNVGLEVDQVLDVATAVASAGGVELALEAPRSWTYLDDLARFADDAKWRLEMGIQGLAGGCLQPSARLKTRVRGYQLSGGGSGAVSVALSVDVSRLCVLPSWGDQLTGLFVTADPLGYVDGPSMYAFARFDPINSGDPLGLYDQASAEQRRRDAQRRRCAGKSGDEYEKCLEGFDLVSWIDGLIEKAGDYFIEKDNLAADFAAVACYTAQSEFPDSTDQAVIEACVTATGGKAAKELGGLAVKGLQLVVKKKADDAAEVIEETAEVVYEDLGRRPVLVPGDEDQVVDVVFEPKGRGSQFQDPNNDMKWTPKPDNVKVEPEGSLKATTADTTSSAERARAIDEATQSMINAQDANNILDVFLESIRAWRKNSKNK